MDKLKEKIRGIIDKAAKKFITFDDYDTMGNYYIDEALSAICELFEDSQDIIRRLDKLLLDKDKEIEELKKGICEHVAQDVIDTDCKLCQLALSEKGYPLWVEKAKKYKEALEKIASRKYYTLMLPSSVAIARKCLEGK